MGAEGEVSFDRLDLEAEVGRHDLGVVVRVDDVSVRVERAVAVEAGSVARREVSIDLEEAGEVAEGQTVPDGQVEAVVSAGEPAADRADL